MDMAIPMAQIKWTRAISEVDGDVSFFHHYHHVREKTETESGLWSPPLRRKAFLDSPAGNVCSDVDQLFSNLKKPNWPKRFFSLFVHAFWCTR
ncbi:hypothetical protein F8388_000456 [Cannabis sativa]|uniref:Uncharacterized protein n=1 Tax=Cannabis sativa TaxID=3483 RepID=A0A7J6HFG4_CANSA|nr:hypothetical protein F8388_000456 [Cannabis sativa]KAF4394047.1 hypothetical protein G4B88_026016 [Cannabis sativa]